MNKEQFLEGLHNDKVLSESLIVRLKKEDLPLVMWGCGDVGDAVCDYLEENGIVLSCIWVDGSSGEKTYRGMPVVDLPVLTEKYEKFNVILGHSCYEIAENVCGGISQIQQVFYAFSIHYQQYDVVKYESIMKEADRFVQLCNLLADEASVNNLLAYLNTKMTGDATYILNIFEQSMSFYKNDVFSVRDDEVFLDIGAYNGDTIRLFLQETNGKYKKIFAFEPDAVNFLALSEYVAKERMRNVVTSLLGAWNKREDLQFISGKEQISSVYIDNDSNSTDVITCYADRIDEIIREEVTFIKINYYEGVLEAIQGCENILREYHPKLAIDVGFDIYNVLLLFEYLASLKLNYRFFLRFNHAMSSTLTMYVI